MPSPLPVPSKGALRTLRNLALGTSCTIAFSTGLLTEDRRRRIHAAREVHENAKKLKASRNYHSASSAAIADTFEDHEDQTLRHKDGGLYQEPTYMEKSPSPYLHVATSETPHASAGNAVARDKDNGSRREEEIEIQKLDPPKKDAETPAWRPPMERQPPIRKYGAYDPPKLNVELASLSTSSPEHKALTVRHTSRTGRLVADVNSLLENARDSGTIDAAAGRFFEAIEDGIEFTSGIGKPLLETAARLSDACWRQSKFEACEKILGIVIGNGPIDEAAFMSFHPFDTIENLLQGPLGNDNHVQIDQAKLRKAAAIFLTRFKRKPGVLSDHGMALGLQLCAETCRVGMNRLTIDLYWRIAASSYDDAYLDAVQYLIIAEHREARHKKVLSAFLRLFTKTNPQQQLLYIVGNLAMDSALTLQKMDKAEQVLVSASKIAETRGLVASTTWVLKLLGYQWRSKRDIVETQALFDRIEHLVRLTSHPQGAYSAMIQFCVEAGNEATALMYQARFEELYGLQKPDLRTCGHFALAKAMRQDWLGVKEDFRQMSTFTTEDDNEVYTAIFLPILLRFVKSHPINEIEDFLRLFTEQYKMPLNIFISNAMVDAYAQHREIDSISRWLQYAASMMPAFNAVTMNIIINNCHKKWEFSFDECYVLYRSIRKLQQGQGEPLVDQTTISILRDIALAESDGSPHDTHRKLTLLGSVPGAAYPTDSHGTRQMMVRALVDNNPGKALNIYKRALQSHVPLDSETLVTATRASLAMHGLNMKPTAELLQEAQRNRQDIVHALAAALIFQWSESANDPYTEKMDIMSLLNNMSSTLKDRNFVVPAAATQSAYLLVERGMYREAVDLWTKMSRQQGLLPTSIDLVTVTVLFQAYVGLRDTAGVKWFSNILSSNNLTPDMRLVRRLKNACAEARKWVQAAEMTMDESGPTMKELRAYNEALDNALGIAYDIRRIRREVKEDVRYKTIKVMQEALEAQKGREPGCEALTTKSSDAQIQDRMQDEIPTSLPSRFIGGDEPLDAGADYVNQAEYGQTILKPDLLNAGGT